MSWQHSKDGPGYGYRGEHTPQCEHESSGLATPLLRDVTSVESMHFSPLTTLPDEALGRQGPAPCLGGIVELALVEETRMSQPQSHDC